ncbi:hypothetical protein GCM10010253_58430 [Streptomyces badius]|uniref:Uncharacterized protein n=1 Tax=Streptomyces badius TaxID=1941 RepID=A0ABQ2TL24_STRBA|nr:hypothetical protein GCM10010253_58430 [Streptomyces badius]
MSGAGAWVRMAVGAAEALVAGARRPARAAVKAALAVRRRCDNRDTVILGSSESEGARRRDTPPYGDRQAHQSFAQAGRS